MNSKIALIMVALISLQCAPRCARAVNPVTHNLHPHGATDAGRLKPRAKIAHVNADDGIKNPSFEKFRAGLIGALRKHDREYLEKTLSPEIEMAIGGGKGKKEFQNTWQNLIDTSPIWQRLERVVTHGAQYDAESGEFHAPSVSFEDSHSDFPQGIVWTKSGTLYKERNDTAPALQNLYDTQLTIIEPAEASPVFAEWVKVKTNSGATGYMKTQDVYSSYDEFAVFKLRQKAWVLSWFGFANL